jgi:hypothetical protein
MYIVVGIGLCCGASCVSFSVLNCGVLTRPKPETADSNKWTTFTYHSPKIRAITNLFKNTNINFAFRPATTTEKFLR